jgi:hypothetical protein
MTRYHHAYGTGLEYDAPSASWKVVDDTKGTWVESRWDVTRVRVFLAMSSLSLGLELVVGLFITLSTATFILYSHVIF